MTTICPACGADPIVSFYKVERVPVHSVRLLRTREEAVSFPTGEIDLGFCPACGFITNMTFDPGLQDYSAEYESTQAYSSTFNSFSNRLARQMVDRYQLQKKKVIEIGCGQGEFLSAICELGPNTGIGFDPAYDASRPGAASGENLSIIVDYYSEKYAGINADFIISKMTLEHIQDVSYFVDVIRKSVGSQYDTTVFIQLPDVHRVLKETAFWDIYYEHCSYFSLGSIARLLRQHAFDVRGLLRDYDDQYLLLDAVPSPGVTQPGLPQENDLDEITGMIKTFTPKAKQLINHYKQVIKEHIDQNKKVVLWGSGSKGVAFLTTLGICEEIEFTVDINPNKENTYMATTGQKVVLPAFMGNYRPDLVILMNPIYQQEVQADLARLRLAPQILSVG